MPSTHHSLLGIPALVGRRVRHGGADAHRMGLGLEERGAMARMPRSHRRWRAVREANLARMPSSAVFPKLRWQE